METTMGVAVFWFRRDLRLEDNAGLFRALTSGHSVLPIFIFDQNILDKLDNQQDARVTFIHQEVSRLKTELEQLGSSLRVFYSTPIQAFEQLSTELVSLKVVFTNEDYEPYARTRDEAIERILAKKNVAFNRIKDHVIFEKNEIAKDDGKPHTVFTPYRTKWLAKLNDFYLKPYPAEKYFHNLLPVKPSYMPSLADMGFLSSAITTPTREVNLEVIKTYHKTRDFPALAGTSRLSVHLRFGTVSIRQLAQVAKEHNFSWLSELIWREFYQMILWHSPHSANQAFKPQYEQVNWRNNETEFGAWCVGQTGYPIVDAGMRELNQTGFMHNRVRMIVASFLTKHLLIDWRWGERYFAEKLLDFDLASNVGGWQWAASSGCDAVPYFRIFNPALQAQKFDPLNNYIQKWVPEWNENNYPKPIVDHAFARERTLIAYKHALGSK